MSHPEAAPERRGAGIVTLTTDFGTRSSYVGSMKGALLSVSPRLTLVDLTHEILPFDVGAAALLLEAAVPAFPPGVVHLAVVDPGVGGPRRPLVLFQGGRWFVGPDNGLFTSFLTDDAVLHAIDPGLAPGTLSATFHGRDLFAPLAARLAAGRPPERLGPAVPDPVRLAWPAPRREPGGVSGEVIQVDGFGNLVTNLRSADLAGLGPELAVEIAGLRMVGLNTTYAERTAGECLALLGSGGRLEIAVARGDAARTLGVGVGAGVRVLAAAPPRAPR